MTAVVEPRPASQDANLTAVARGGALNFAGVVANGLLSFVLVYVLAHALGAERYGSFAAAMALFMILANVGELGADTGMLHRLPRLLVLRQRRDLAAVILVGTGPVLLVGVGLAGAVFSFAGPIADVLVRDGSGAVAAVYLESLAPFLAVASALAVALSAVRAFGRQRLYVAVQNLAIPLTRPLLVLVAVLLGAKGAGIGLAYGLPLALGFLVVAPVLGRAIRAAERAGASDPPARPPRAIAAEFWRFTGARGVAAALAVTSTWIALLLVSALRSGTEAGVFSAVMRYVVMGTFALQAARVVLGPQVSRLLAQDRRADTERVFQTATWWLVALSWPYYLILAVYPDVALGVFGAEFSQGARALVVLSLAELIDTATGNVTLVLLMGGRSSWNLVNIVVGLTVALGLDILLIPDLGLLGAALGWAAGIVVENVAAVLEVAFLMRIRPFGSGFGYVAAAALASYALVGLGMRAVAGGATALVATLLLGTATYGVLLYRWRHHLRLGVLRESLPIRGLKGSES